MSVQRVAVIADHRVMPFELSLAGRVLGTAVDSRGRELYDIRVCTADGRPAATTGGFDVTPRYGPEAVADADLVVVPPAPHHPELTRDGAPSPLQEVLTTAREDARIATVCLGSYVPASLGWLDGRSATTHWVCVDHFAERFPDVDVDPQALYVDEGRLLTSAGATAGIDMLLHIVRSDHGSAVANDVARRCVVPSWRDGGQLQYIAHPVRELTESGLDATLAWALDRLAEPLGIDDLAGHARMSRRTFTRRFRAVTGTSPTAWLLDKRTDYAKLLLETTEQPIDDVAHAAGFGSASALRKHLRAHAGVSPSAYRKSFHG
ncbi:MAG: helix-turn-helix domain-containing protein [Gordonia sp. (in: high G+C Gram-positive bacteria)]